MGTPSTSIVRHRRPDGSRNTAASAVVVTASVAARATAERSRRVNDLPPMTAVTPRPRPSATFTRSPRNRYRLPMRSCSHRRHPNRHQTHLLHSQARVPQLMRVWDMVVGEDAGHAARTSPAYGWTIHGRLSWSFRPLQRRLPSAARWHHPRGWRGPVTALVADPVDGSAQVPGGVGMDEDNLTRVDPDAEDRVRLVAQRPAQAVEDIGFHRSTLPFRSPTRPPGPSRNRDRRAAGDESGRRASGAERTRETCRRSAVGAAWSIRRRTTCPP